MDKKQHDWVKYLPVALLVIVLVIRGLLLYWGFIYDHYLVPPGGDPAVHTLVIEKILSTGKILLEDNLYPPGYHLLIAGISKIFSGGIIDIVRITGPMFVLLAIISVYIMGTKWFGHLAGVISAGVAGLTGTSLVTSYADGNYPNLMAIFFSVIALTYLVEGFRKKPFHNGIVALVAFALLGVTHHLSTIIIGAVAIIYFIVLSFLTNRDGYRLRNYSIVRHYFWITLVIAVTLVGYFSGKELFMPTLQSILAGKLPSYSDVYLSKLPSMGTYSLALGSIVLTGGVFGLMLMITEKDYKDWEKRLFIIVWAVLIFALTRMTWHGMPSRLIRELTIPMSISCGYAGAWIIHLTQTRMRQIASAGILAFGLMLNTNMLYVEPYLLPNGFKNMIWFSRMDYEKAKILNLLPDHSIIAGTPSSPYFQFFLDNKEYKITANLKIAQYIFISPITEANPDPKAYPYFAHYARIEEILKKYKKAEKIYSFGDGTVIKKVISAK